MEAGDTRLGQSVANTNLKDFLAGEGEEQELSVNYPFFSCCNLTLTYSFENFSIIVKLKTVNF